MREISSSVIVATSLLISACGSEETDTVAARSGDEASVQASAEAGEGKDGGLLMGFSDYPDAKVIIQTTFEQLLWF